MLARLRKSAENKDSGFTLIELLVVMIIIGILAAIAIPAFLSQRAKARDTSTKADVSTAGKEIATYFVDGAGTLTASQTGQVVTITDGAGGYSTTVNLSKGTALQTAPAATAGFTPTPTSLNWCIGMTNPQGSSQNNWKYSATTGLVAGSCP